MRFTIIYANKTEIRDKVIALLLSAISQGHDLTKQSIQHPLFASEPNWPSSDFFKSFPLKNQCEEMEYVDGSLRTLRLLVNDAEIIEIKQNETQDNSIQQSN